MLSAGGVAAQQRGVAGADYKLVPGVIATAFKHRALHRRQNIALESARFAQAYGFVERVVAEFGGEPVPSTAVVLDGDERDEVFAWAADQNRTFAKYQSRTDRTIPVVRLDPKE